MPGGWPAIRKLAGLLPGSRYRARMAVERPRAPSRRSHHSTWRRARSRGWAFFRISREVAGRRGRLVPCCFGGPVGDSEVCADVGCGSRDGAVPGLGGHGGYRFRTIERGCIEPTLCDEQPALSLSCKSGSRDIDTTHARTDFGNRKRASGIGSAFCHPRYGQSKSRISFRPTVQNVSEPWHRRRRPENAPTVE
jgi:hypothetical protein